MRQQQPTFFDKPCGNLQWGRQYKFGDPGNDHGNLPDQQNCKDQQRRRRIFKESLHPGISAFFKSRLALPEKLLAAT